MKRFRHIVHLCLVSLTIALVAVHPAAACRLLRGRCCCCRDCCSPCEPAECTLPAKELPPAATPEPGEASPSDAPPRAATGAGQQHTPTHAATPADVVIPQTTTTQNSPAISGATLTFGEPAPPQPVMPGRFQPIVEPDFPVPTAESRARMPAAATIIENAVAPPVEVTTTPTTASNSPQPAPQSLRPRQKLATEAGRGTPIANPPANAASNPTPPLPPLSRRTAEPPRTDTVPPPPALSRPVTQPSAPPAAGPVAAPAFPKADDDPFAPRTPVAPVTPASPPPAADDPFAPLPKVEAPKPLVAEPTTLKIADALLPGTDGRLPVREWRDDSGRFQIKARLIIILDGKVRLLKETNRTTTVPLTRLSQEDQAYVNEIISRYGKDLTGLDKFAYDASR